MTETCSRDGQSETRRERPRWAVTPNLGVHWSLTYEESARRHLCKRSGVLVWFLWFRSRQLELRASERSHSRSAFDGSSA
jgi:hypothetical protein